MSTKLLSDIEAFLAETGMSASRFGFNAVRNSRLVERLRDGTTPKGKPVRVWPETETEIRAYMRAIRLQQQEAAE